MRLTAKMRAARESLARRFHPGISSGRECVVILDRLRFLCDENPTEALRGLRGFRSLQGHRINRTGPESFQPYGRVHWFRRKGSAMKFCVDSERLEEFLAPYRVTLYADDRTGLLPGEVLSILQVMPGVKLTMVELAFDFSPISPVTRAFVRRHAVFGKSQRDLSASNPAGDWWGTRKGSKRVKSYYKREVCAQRVEFELHSRFLRHSSDVFDFARLAELLARGHVLFARLDDQKLAHRLRNSRLRASKTLQILRSLGDRERDLWVALRYLRRTVGLKNVRRLLVTLPVNRLIREALEAWAAKWPKKPQRL
jgi:hypothetical protein